jgi:hypothetical protein
MNRNFWKKRPRCGRGHIGAWCRKVSSVCQQQTEVIMKSRLIAAAIPMFPCARAILPVLPAAASAF